MTHDEAILRFKGAKPGLPPDLATAEFELLLPARFAMPDVMLPLIDSLHGVIAYNMCIGDNALALYLGVCSTAGHMDVAEKTRKMITALHHWTRERDMILCVVPGKFS